MPGGLSQSGSPVMAWAGPANAMGPQHPAGSYSNEGWQNEWSMKRSPAGMSEMGPGMQPTQLQGLAMQTQGQGWQPAQGWQGQLGPNLMPMTGGPEMQPMGGSQNMQNILPVRGAPLAQEMPGSNADNIQNYMGLHNADVTPDARDQQRPDMLPNMQMPMQPVPQQQPPEWSQQQPAPQVSNMQLGQMQQQQPVPQQQHVPQMQIIALPVGAPPPEGAIPVGPAPAGAVQEHVVAQMLAMPMGDAPSDGGQFPTGSATSPSQSDPASPPHHKSRAFKIKDPRTGREVTETDAASRRLRIVNPKTGEEVRPNL